MPRQGPAEPAGQDRGCVAALLSIFCLAWASPRLYSVCRAFLRPPSPSAQWRVCVASSPEACCPSLLPLRWWQPGTSGRVSSLLRFVFCWSSWVRADSQLVVVGSGRGCRKDSPRRYLRAKFATRSGASAFCFVVNAVQERSELTHACLPAACMLCSGTWHSSTVSV